MYPIYPLVRHREDYFPSVKRITRAIDARKSVKRYEYVVSRIFHYHDPEKGVMDKSLLEFLKSCLPISMSL